VSSFAGASSFDDSTSSKQVTFDSILSLGSAEVYYGCTPPGVQYWGFDSIISGRTFPRSSLPGNSSEPFEQWWPGVNFADPVNSVNTVNSFKSSSSIEKSREIVVIYAADETAASAIKTALVAYARVDPSIVHVLKLDSRVFSPVSGKDLKDFDSWKGSRPDQLRHLVRGSIPEEPEAEGPGSWTAFKASAFPFYHFEGNPTALEKSRPYEPESKPREIGADEPAEVAAELAALVEVVRAAQKADGYELDSMGTATDENFGLYDDWEEVLEHPEETISRDSYPAGTRDGTYGVAFSPQPIGGSPERLVAVGARHKRTVLRASYSQFGVNVYAAGGYSPTPGVPPDAMPFSAWFGDENLESLGGGEDDLLWYLEVPLSGADCSEAAREREGCCIMGATGLDLEGGTVLFGSRTYALEKSGLGASKDEIFEVKLFLFKQ